jgi:predicted esterase
MALALGAAHLERAAAQTSDRTVAAPTRLDWAFAVQGFGAGSDRLPAGFDSTKQRYQLFVPKQYKPGQLWPLLLFISAGDQPAGWDAWKKVCEQEGVFFCSPYAAGNGIAVGARTRTVLDVLDDVRRAYRIDPDQTYLSGFSGGARMACAIGFALPEYVAGVVPICGTNPIAGPTYLRHRLQDRVSAAFVTGEKDFNRKENEEYMAPWFKDLGIRSKLWVVPKLGHAIPSGDVLREAYSWLQEDLPRRRSDAKVRPELAAAPDDGFGGAESGRRLMAAGQRELKQPDRTWRGVALIQGSVRRGGNAVAKQAGQLLEDLLKDEAVANRIAEEGARDEQLALASQARALERFGQAGKAIEAWAILAKNYLDTPVGRDAEEQVRRLKLPTAFLGIGLKGNVIDQLAPQGPAEKAGLKVGDTLVKVGDRRIESPDDMFKVVQSLKPGARVRVDLLRDQRPIDLTIEVGTRPMPAKQSWLRSPQTYLKMNYP